MAKALRMLSSNSLPPEVAQDEESATYVKKLKKSDGLIDWNLPALDIERKIRAYCPWPGCYTFLPERLRKKGTTGRVMIQRARFAKLSSLEPGWKSCAPGTVLKLERTGPVIKCLDTALILTELKPEGGKIMDGGAFLRGRQLLAHEDCLVLQ